MNESQMDAFHAACAIARAQSITWLEQSAPEVNADMRAQVVDTLGKIAFPMIKIAAMADVAELLESLGHPGFADGINRAIQSYMDELPNDPDMRVAAPWKEARGDDRN